MKTIEDKIVILQELKDFLPEISNLQMTELTNSVLDEGLRDPIILWDAEEYGGYVLIDGHHRYQILQANGKKLKENNYVIYDFDTMDDVKEFMIRTQIQRRNVTSNQLARFRGMQMDLLKQKGDRYGQGRVRDVIAHQHGVDSRTIQRDYDFHRGIQKIERDNPELAQSILNNKERGVNKNTIQKIGQLTEAVPLNTKKDIQQIKGKTIVKGKIVTKEDEIPARAYDQLEKTYVSLDKDLYGRGKEYSKAKGWSFTYLIELALQEYFERRSLN